jgi:aromatic-amino-acid transaminase
LSDSKTQKAVSSQAAITVRKMFSNPPAFGGYVAEKVLGNPDYCQKWEAELTSMRERLINLRAEFTQKLNDKNLGVDFSFIKNQTGLFAYTGLNQKQAEFARDKHAVYLLNSGRICVAALNKNNLDHVVSVIASSFEIK